MYMVIKMVVAMHVYVWCESVGHGGGTTERGKACGQVKMGEVGPVATG